jgi:hypothetical protein
MDNIAQCRSCGKRILFIRTKSGKNMPVDTTFVNYKNNPGGKDRIVLPSGDVIACDANVDAKDADGYGYISHFATCPNANKHRRR